MNETDSWTWQNYVYSGTVTTAATLLTASYVIHRYMHQSICTDYRAAEIGRTVQILAIYNVNYSSSSAVVNVCSRKPLSNGVLHYNIHEYLWSSDTVTWSTGHMIRQKSLTWAQKHHKPTSNNTFTFFSNMFWVYNRSCGQFKLNAQLCTWV